MHKEEILVRINELIVDEKGSAVTMGDKTSDAQLDSLGLLMLMVSLDTEFPIFDGKSEEEYQSLYTSDLTIEELILECELSIK